MAETKKYGKNKNIEIQKEEEKKRICPEGRCGGEIHA